MTHSSVVALVAVPPHKIQMLNEEGVAQGESVGPYLEGQHLRLYCDVHGGEYCDRSPIPSYLRPGPRLIGPGLFSLPVTTHTRTLLPTCYSGFLCTVARGAY